MIIPVMGMDPSFTNWGLGSVDLDLTTGIPSTPYIQLIEPLELSGKNIRVNSNDLHRAEQIARVVIEGAKKVKAVFAEVPVGSQSARAMASYGICVGIISTIRAMGIPVIEVTAIESKLALTGKKTATKLEMIEAAFQTYPEANWLIGTKGKEKGKLIAKNEHMADAIAAIHAGVNTPVFQQLMHILKG
jgi:hypothetical protein